MKFRKRPGGPAFGSVGPGPALGRQADSEGYTESLGAAGPGRAVPRWVKVFVVVAAVFVILLLVVFTTGLGGPHGPGRHLGAPPDQLSIDVTWAQGPALSGAMR